MHIMFVKYFFVCKFHGLIKHLFCICAKNVLKTIFSKRVKHLHHTVPSPTSYDDCLLPPLHSNKNQRSSLLTSFSTITVKYLLFNTTKVRYVYVLFCINFVLLKN